MWRHVTTLNLKTPRRCVRSPTPAQQQHKDSPVGVLGSARVGLAKLIGSKEVVQEFVVLALPSIPIKENTDPGYYALKKQDRQRPNECQGDSLEVGQAAASAALLSTAHCTHWQSGEEHPDDSKSPCTRRQGSHLQSDTIAKFILLLHKWE